MEHLVINADCLEHLSGMASDSVDLIVTSPPYEAARTYGIDFKLDGQEWVEWAAERYLECYRVSRGLVAWVVEGRTRQFAWSATPVLLMAELHRQGVRLRKPPAFHRVGIPGSGGPDWLRNDYEFIVCASKGKLPWSDNTAMGAAPKYAPGGAMSYRRTDGKRKTDLPGKAYKPPKRTNPGNVIHCKVGGGLMGSPLAHENEAPFPETLVEFFVRSFCPPCGTVLDPFSGSGTTACVAKRWGRWSTSIDIRESQTELTERRLLQSIELTEDPTP